MTLTDEQAKTLLKYTKPCLPGCTDIRQLPNINQIETFLADETRTPRDYFLGPHNREAYSKGNFIHMVTPFKIKGKTGRVPEEFTTQFPNFPQALRQRNLKPSELTKKIIYIHAGSVVDSE